MEGTPGSVFSYPSLAPPRAQKQGRGVDSPTPGGASDSGKEGKKKGGRGGKGAPPCTVVSTTLSGYTWLGEEKGRRAGRVLIVIRTFMTQEGRRKGRRGTTRPPLTLPAWFNRRVSGTHRGQKRGGGGETPRFRRPCCAGSVAVAAGGRAKNG